MPYPLPPSSVAPHEVLLAPRASEASWTEDFEAPRDSYLHERAYSRNRSVFSSPASSSPLQMPVPRSMREISGVRSGGSSVAIGIAVGGGVLGTLTAISVSIIAIMGLLSAEPVYPFNVHGGVHRAPAYALIGCTAGLLIPVGGFLAGALTFGGIALLGACIFY